MAQRFLSPFEQLAFTNPVLDRIAFYIAVDPFLGPPSNLVPLLLTSRSVYNHLCFQRNSPLYASIFRHKFDCAAVERRLSPGWTFTPYLAEELRARCIALKYIRRGTVALDDDRDALWSSYLMMLENDGCNEKQLCNWANLPRWAISAVALRCLPFRVSPDSTVIFSDPEGTSLAVWLLWMISDKEHVRGEDKSTRNMVLNSVLPLIGRGYQHPSVYAPDAHFYLPLCKDHDKLTCFPGPVAPVSIVRYYGRQLRLAVPPLTAAALLNFVVRREARQDNTSLQISNLPATRQEAIARGFPSPSLTQEDIREFHYHTRTHYFKQQLNDGGTLSEQLDKEWFRMASCHDIWAIERPLRGVVYSLGTLVGDWCGRILVPDPRAYLNHHIPPTALGMSHERIACRFEEHHCLRFNEPLVAPACPTCFGGEDILNAWLPRDLRVVRKANGLQIFDHSTGKDTWYETYHPDRAEPYSTTACLPLLGESRLDHRDVLPSSTLGDANPLDEYEEYIEETLSGVQDIIITGETSVKQGEAWGHYSYIGRVRQWDGLVVLLRIPVHDPITSRGRAIFKGYVHGQSLVGRWRDTTTDMQAVGYEGGFVLCRQDE